MLSPLIDKPKSSPPRSHKSQGEAPQARLERQAQDVARSLPRVAGGPMAPGAVAPRLREPIEQLMGADLSQTRIHTNTKTAAMRAARADAAAQGSEIYFAPGRFQPSHPEGQELIQHELVHLAQQQVGTRRDDVADTSSERIAAAEQAILYKVSPLNAHSRQQFGLCSSSAKDTLRKKGALSSSEAIDVMDDYRGLSASERDELVREFHSTGDVNSALQKLLAALPKRDVSVTFRAEVKDLLQRVQAQAAVAYSGKTVPEMGEVQGKYRQAEDKAAALKDAAEQAKKSGKPPPATVSSAEVDAARQRRVDKDTIMPPPAKTEWDNVANKAAWFTHAEKVRDKMIAAVQKAAPELGITKRNINLDPKRIAERGKNVYALSGNPLTVGIGFIKTADANPEYVIGTIVHEIQGHPAHGSSDESLGMLIFDESTKRFPSQKDPSRQKDVDLYGYQETELYSELVEFGYWIPISKADAAKKITGGDIPQSDVPRRIHVIKRQFEPTIAKAILVGLYERFRIDPRLTKKAIKLYLDSANAAFPGLLTP